jgi:hypothetical protein
VLSVMLQAPPHWFCVQVVASVVFKAFTLYAWHAPIGSIPIVLYVLHDCISLTSTAWQLRSLNIRWQMHVAHATA